MSLLHLILRLKTLIKLFSSHRPSFLTTDLSPWRRSGTKQVDLGGSRGFGSCLPAQGPGPASQLGSSREHLRDSTRGAPPPAPSPPPVLGPGLAGGLLSPDALPAAWQSVCLSTLGRDSSL